MPAVSSELRQVASQIATTLSTHGIPDSNLEAEVLLRHVLKYDRARFYASLREQLSGEKLEIVKSLLNRRTRGEPLAYITQHKEFYGLDFCVTPTVLIPRQETELLVEEALKFAVERGDGNITIADIGTGSGAIAVSLAANLSQAKVYATDCSREALEVADLNRRKHRVANRITLLEGDLLDPLPLPVDLIVSNPPYISSDLLPGLAPEVRREPRLALDGGKEGLEVINRLLKQAPAKLNAGGSILVEISPEQLNAVRDLARAYFPDAVIECHSDLSGLPRCVAVSTKK